MANLFNSFTKNLDKIFDDKCLYNKAGSVNRGPGLICGFYILFTIVSTIRNIIKSQKLIEYGFTRKQILIQNIIDILISVLSIIFIYHMCFICRGFIGFLVVVFFIHVVINLMRSVLFKNYNDYNDKLLMLNLKDIDSYKSSVNSN
tara:strand:+ start:158 stop:595 length:438 start_codon:yes stop_codon:yes gene_type:complete